MPQKRAVSQDRLTEEQLRRIEKYDPRERVRAYLRDSHAAENAANAHEYASQRSKRNDDPIVIEQGDGTSKEATVDVTSVSDELNGKHAKKQRLAERQEQKRRRAAVCKPQPPDSSAGDSDDGDDALPRRSKRSHSTKDKKLTVQDRSQSKAAQIKEKGRRQKDDDKGKKSKSRGFMEMLTSLKALQPRPTRMTIPQLPRQGIFSVGTSSPHEVVQTTKRDEKKDRHRGKRVRRASQTPCRCDHNDKSMSSSVSASSANDGKTERIKALESTVERLTRMMALQEKRAKETQESATSTSSEASLSSTVREGIHAADRVAGLQKNKTEVANSKTPFAVLDVSSMAWAERRDADRAPTVKEEAEHHDTLNAEPQREKHNSSLAFRNGRPDQHPTNGWRSQHRVDEIGVDELQRRFFAVGGPRFRVSSPVPDHEEQPSAFEISVEDIYPAHHPHSKEDDMPEQYDGHSHHATGFQEQDIDEYAASAHRYDADEVYYENDDATWRTRDRMPDAHGYADEDHFTSSPAFERQHEEHDTYLVDGLPSFCTISKKDLPSMWQPARRY